ncbi:MAG: NAD-dependent epimerase/dehydratase family protein [Myxococcota bacterium]
MPPTVRRSRKKKGPRPYDPDRRVVAVTGAHSFLGAELLRRLERDPRFGKLLAIDVRRPDGLERSEFHRLDLTAPNAASLCGEILSEARVDTFVHLAFLSGPTHNSTWAHELEAIGTVHVLEACSLARVRKFVMSSTTGVYGPHPLNPNFLPETAELRGLGQSRFFNDKVEAEREAQRFQEESQDAVVTVLRFAPILGPGISNYVSRFFRRPAMPVLMGFDPLLQLVHEDDAVTALELACDHDFPGAFNIVGEGVLPYTTMIARLGKLPVPIPHFVAYPLAKLLWMTQVMESPPTFLDWLRYLCVADGRKARELLGFIPRHDVRGILDDFLGLPASHASSAEDVRP